MSDTIEEDLFSIDEDIPTIDITETLTDEENEITQLSRNGYSFLKINEIDKAEEEFHKVLEHDKNNNYALVGLGDASRKRLNYRKAIEFYSDCLEHHPSNNYALFGLADCYKNLNLYTMAIEMWAKYLEHDNTNITVLTRIADAYRKTHDFANSKKIYNQVFEIEPDNVYALIGLAHLHYEFKKYREALAYWEKVIKQNEDKIDIRILTSIGNCYRKMKLFNEGIIYFKKTLEQDPKNFYGLFGLADCYRGINQQKTSIIYWKKILEQEPENKVILTRLGDAYSSLGMYDEAEKRYQEALDIDYDAYAVLGLAILCKIQGKYEKAITSLSRLLQVDKKNYRVYLELANCYIHSSQKSKAIDILKSFQKFGIKNQAINNLLNSLL